MVAIRVSWSRRRHRRTGMLYQLWRSWPQDLPHERKVRHPLHAAEHSLARRGMPSSTVVLPFTLDSSSATS